MDNEGAINPELVFMLKMLAEDNDFESQKTLSYMYFEGEGLNKDIDKSLFWSNVCLSNELCNEEEMLIINLRIGHILMVQKDYKGALEKYIFLFDSGKLNPGIKNAVHICIADAYYYLKDDRATEIYEYIINNQHLAIGDYNIIFIYERLGSIYVNKKDFKQAIEILNKGLKLGTPPDSNFLNSLGFAYEMSENFNLAFKYYLLASEKNNAYANLNLAYLYENGLNVDKNIDKASMYYEKGKKCLEEWKMAREKFIK